MSQALNSAGPGASSALGAAHQAVPEAEDTALTPALRGVASAAAEVIRRLAARDPGLRQAVEDPSSDAAARVRALLLEYLAHGTWHGQRRPAGRRSARDNLNLRALISYAACEGGATGWHATLLRALHAPDAGLRRTSVALVGECDQPDVLPAAVEALGDADEGVRWAAAIALGRRDGAVVVALLGRLAGRALGPEMRHTAAYVLREVPDAALRRRAQPVVEALDRSDYRVAVPLAAGAALGALRRDADGETATTGRAS